MTRTLQDEGTNLFVQRWNAVVHILIPYVGIYPIVIDRNGRVTRNSFPGTCICGQKVKMGGGSNNRIVETHPTCIRCIGGP